MAIIDGTSRTNRLKGTAGSDTITGFGGDDRLIGDLGDDILYGDDQALVAPFGFGADTLIGGGGRDALIGGAGDDVLIGGAGNDLLIAGLAAQVRWDGEAGSYVAATGVDGGDDVLDGGAGIDRAVIVLDRAAGVRFDIHDARATAVVTSGGARIGSITGIESVDFYGGRGADAVIGGLLGDWLHGRGGNDTLQAGEGNDLLDGGAGDDVLDGGTGFDVASYADAAAGVRIDLHLIGQAQATGGAGTDTLIDIEQLDGSRFADTLLGGDGADFISGGSDGNDLVSGGAGDDYLSATRSVEGGAGDSISRLIGGSGSDTLVVTLGLGVTDRVHASGGADADRAVVSSAGGTTIADMGGGDDDVLLSLGAGGVTVKLGGGVDTITLQSAGASARAASVADFTAGTNGDRVDLSPLLLAAGHYEAENPFAQGFARLVATATGTALQIDADAGGDDATFTSLLLFAGVAPDAFTAFNFGGYRPVVVDLAPPHAPWEPIAALV